MAKTVTESLIAELNAARGVAYGESGYAMFADIRGDGNYRPAVYTYGATGGVGYDHFLNGTTARKRCQNIRAAIAEAKDSRCVVIVTGQYPPMRIVRTVDRESAEKAVAHFGEMFPHLREGGFLEIIPAVDMCYTCENFGFTRDCAQAYITTGNGAEKPKPGTVEIA
jgi:hypothetical protein